jgi:hypothetical protein
VRLLLSFRRARLEGYRLDDARSLGGIWKLAGDRGHRKKRAVVVRTLVLRTRTLLFALVVVAWTSSCGCVVGMLVADLFKTRLRQDVYML